MSGTQTQQPNQPQNQVDPETKEALSAGTQGQEGVQEEDLGEFADPKKAYAEIKKLRSENAKHRTKAKSLEDELGGMKGTLDKLKSAFGGEQEQVDPAEALQAIQQQNELLMVELSINQLAREYGLTSEQDDYFKFLLNKKFEVLNEGDELSEDDLMEVISGVKKVYGVTPSRNSTGLNANGGNPNPASSASNAITAEQFSKMTLAEKSKVYAENASLYTKLLNEAKEQRLI